MKYGTPYCSQNSTKTSLTPFFSLPNSDMLELLQLEQPPL